MGELQLPALAVKNVRKSFGTLEVLGGVSLNVHAGQFVTLLGPSGCGKTTLLRIIAGLETADAGTIELEGRDLSAIPANQRPVNTVFQHYALFPHLNVYNNVAFGLRARRTAAAEISRRVAATIDMLQIAELAHRFPHQISGGQKQRVALARAVVNEPRVLLLDEPMSALDAKLRAQVQLELRNLQRRLGTTFILVTHDQDEALTVSDRIFLLHHGQIQQEGTPTEVYETPVNRFVAEFLGAANLIAAQHIDHHIQTAFGPLVPRTTPSWTTGTLAIRPERIRVVPQLPSINGLAATVRELIYRGDHKDLLVDPGPLRIRVPSSLSIYIGQKLFLELPPQNLEVLRD